MVDPFISSYYYYERIIYATDTAVYYNLEVSGRYNCGPYTYTVTPDTVSSYINIVDSGSVVTINFEATSEEDITALDPNPVTFTVSVGSADYPSTVSASANFNFEIKHVCEDASFAIDIPELGGGNSM